ncbi:MAG: DUF86 domain-containing protein [Deltaproteobacteria bacterium]|nr:DUF86 domain-containing protein [Deltaproteobacteria bacterium]
MGNIREYLTGLDYDAFTRDKKTRDAAARNLEIIGEDEPDLSRWHTSLS